jgi:hypothetical protein
MALFERAAERKSSYNDGHVRQRRISRRLAPEASAAVEATA